jgi:hypothetical protein
MIRTGHVEEQINALGMLVSNLKKTNTWKT